MTIVRETMGELDKMLDLSTGGSQVDFSLNDNFIFSPSCQKIIDERLFLFDFSEKINFDVESTIIHELFQYFQSENIDNIFVSKHFQACFPPNMPFHRLKFLTKALSYSIYESKHSQSSHFLDLCSLTLLLKDSNSKESTSICHSLINDYIYPFEKNNGNNLQNNFIIIPEISPYFAFGLITSSLSSVIIHHEKFLYVTLFDLFEIFTIWIRDSSDVFMGLLNTINNTMIIKELIILNLIDSMFISIGHLCEVYDKLDRSIIKAFFKFFHLLIDFLMRYNLSNVTHFLTIDKCPNDLNSTIGTNIIISSTHDNPATLYFKMTPKLIQHAENTFSQLLSSSNQARQIFDQQINNNLVDFFKSQSGIMSSNLCSIFAQTLYITYREGLMTCDNMMMKEVTKYLPADLIKSNTFLSKLCN